MRLCHKPFGQPSNSIVKCFVTFKETVCLICPVEKVEKRLAWYAGNDGRLAFRDGHRITDVNATVNVNECDGNLYSLMISNTNIENVEERYTCRQQQVTLADFWLQTQGMGTL